MFGRRNRVETDTDTDPNELYDGMDLAFLSHKELLQEFNSSQMWTERRKFQ